MQPGEKFNRYNAKGAIDKTIQDSNYDYKDPEMKIYNTFTQNFIFKYLDLPCLPPYDNFTPQFDASVVLGVAACFDYNILKN